MRGLRSIAAEELVNYSEVFIGGVPQEVEVDILVGNFTGCVGISSAAMFETPAPSCTVNIGQKECSYCLNQVQILRHLGIKLCVGIKNVLPIKQHYIFFFFHIRLCYQHHSMEPAMQNFLRSVWEMILTSASVSGLPFQKA